MDTFSTWKEPLDAASAHRLAAGRRKAVGLKLRRVVPGLVVGTTTLAGTGGLIAWVAGQPGVKTVATAVARPTPTTNPAQLSAVQKQLQAEEAALQSLQGRLAQIVAQAHASASAAAGGTPVSGSGGSASAAPLAPLPALPVLAPAPAPATNATTGASHAVP
ncbi:MAG TPA: hypothetical protein VNF71_10395 [Acidimicrobiales bacterium]|nr:hypothetical protein [Acidimicrobiales bacterium]